MCARRILLLTAALAVIPSLLRGITVDLSVDSTTITSGQVTTARSTAGPAGQVVYHGIEGRPAGGTWQNWGIWNDSGGTRQSTAVGPSTPGTYELRCYAAGADAVSTVSSSVYLTVNAAPAITVNLSLSPTSISVGQWAVARSTAGPAGQVAYHGVEGRPSGGSWANWGIWNDSGGTQQSQSLSPGAGTYEVRCYAAGPNAVATVSSSSYLTVSPPTNGITWNSIGLPSSGIAGATITFTASVTNSGGTTWDSNYYLELKDWNGNHLYYPSISGVSPGGSTTATFYLTLPSTPGTYNYGFTALQNGVTYFGGTQTRSITVSNPPTAPAAPTANQPTNVSTTQFTANWSTSSGATGYRIDVSPNSAFSSYLSGWQDADKGNVSSATVTGLAAGTAYYYRVRAYNSYGTSGNSNVATATTTANKPTVSGGSASGALNSPFSYQISATNSPTSYGASGLPSGLSVNTSTGLISGTPAQTGTFTVTLSATNAGGTGTNTLTLTISAAVNIDLNVHLPLAQ